MISYQIAPSGSRKFHFRFEVKLVIMYYMSFLDMVVFQLLGPRIA